jgi:O-antigen/teichoic acid export membrane protein
VTFASLVRRVRESRLLREGAWVAAGQGMTIVVRLVGLRVLTELVSPATYGELILLLGLAILGSNIFCAPLLHATLRFHPDAVQAGRLASLRRLLVGLLLRSGGITVVAICAGGALWLEAGEGGTRWLSFALIAVLLLLDVQRMFETNLLNAARRQAACSLWLACEATARVLGAVTALLTLGSSALSILLGYCAGAGLVNLGFRLAVVHAPAPEEDAAGASQWKRGMRAQILRYALPMVPLALLGWVLNQSDRYLLAHLAGAGQAGIYGAAYGLASQPFIVLAATIAPTLRPLLFEAVSREDHRRTRNVFLLWLGALAGCFLAGLLLVGIFADWIVRLVLGEAFWGASEILLWIAAAWSVRGIQQTFEHLIYAYRQTERLLIMNSVGVVTALSLFWLLIPAYGARGAAMAMFFAMSASCLASVVLSEAVPRLLRGATAPDQREAP